MLFDSDKILFFLIAILRNVIHNSFLIAIKKFIVDTNAHKSTVFIICNTEIYSRAISFLRLPTQLIQGIYFCIKITHAMLLSVV